MSEPIHKDILIIGAGMAGLSAARTITQENKHLDKPVDFAVLEANGHIGGRVQTKRIVVPGHDEPVIIHPGAQWFHKDMREGTPENPLLKIAREIDPLIEDPMPRQFYLDGKPDTNKNIELIKAARRAIDGYKGKDIDLANFFTQAALGANNYSLRTTFGEVETGAPLEEVSTHDIRENVACNMGHFSTLGLDKFVEHFAKDVKSEITTGAQVKRIKWDPEAKKDVEVELADGRKYTAKQCILTISVGVLRSGQIAFEPPMPAGHRAQLDEVTMGNFNKAFLIFDKGFQMPVAQNTHIDMRTTNAIRKTVYAGDMRTIEPQDMFCLANDNGGHGRLVTAFFGGDLARLCDSSPEDAINLAIRSLEEIWGPDVRKFLMHTEASRHGADPHVLGGYSRVAIGHHNARQRLAEPFGNVGLAGEAYGTIHSKSKRNWATHMAGAAISGEHAALHSIGQVVGPELYAHRARAIRSRGDFGLY